MMTPLAQALRLYAVTDSRWLQGRTLAEVVQAAIEGGVTFVQLREKQATTNELVQQARELLPICHAAGVPLVINDDIAAAQASGADGVHVGQSDASCKRARRELGAHAIVGVSVQTVEQALAAEAASANYLGVGAMFGTPTKPDAELVTLETLRQICAAVSIPVVAIGGINAENATELTKTGIAGIAVVSAIFAAASPKQAAHQLIKTFPSLPS